MCSKEKKSRHNIYISDKVWNDINKYINCSISEWIEKQMVKQIYYNNDEFKLKRKLDNLEKELNCIELEKKDIETKLKEVKELKDRNNKDIDLIMDCIKLVRTINNNEGCIEETRIEYIANNRNIDYNILYCEIKTIPEIKIIHNK